MKKSKLFLSLMSLCFALAVLCFGVYAANQVNYTISGNISYSVEDVYVNVTTSVYKSTSYMTRLDVRNKIDDASEDITEITGDSDLVLLSDVSDSFDTLNQSAPYEFEDLELGFSTQSGSEAYAYFFVINVKKMSNDVDDCWVAIDDELTEADNTYIYDNMFVYVTDSSTGSNLIVALALDDQTTSIDSDYQDFGFGVRMGLEDIAESDWMMDKLSFNLVEDDEDYYEVSQSSDEIAGLVVIPASYDDVPVKAIAEGGFSTDFDANVREIYLSNTIEELGSYGISCPINNVNLQNFSGNVITEYCFSYSKLVKVVIPENVEIIEEGAFGLEEGVYEGYLEYVKLPSGLKQFGSGNGFTPFVFYGWTHLKYIEMEDGENESFYCQNNCLIGIEDEDKVLLLGCANSIIPNDITKIGNSAFCGNIYLSEINLPSGVTIIEDFAFMHTNLTSIDLSNINIIGQQAFGWCPKLGNIFLSESINGIGEGAFDGTPWLLGLQAGNDGLIFATAGNVKYLMGFDDSKVSSGYNITENKFENVRGLYGRVFAEKSNISKITIPTSVKFIGHYAFGYNNDTLTVEFLATTANQIPTLLDDNGSNGNASRTGGIEHVSAVKIPSGTWDIYASVWTYLFDNYSSKISEVA